MLTLTKRQRQAASGALLGAILIAWFFLSRQDYRITYPTLTLSEQNHRARIVSISPFQYWKRRITTSDAVLTSAGPFQVRFKTPSDQATNVIGNPTHSELRFRLNRDVLASWRAHVNSKSPTLELDLPGEPNLLASFLYRQEYTDKDVVEWFGTLQDGRTVQITLLPRSAVVAVRTPFGLITVKPTGDLVKDHVLSFPNDATSNVDAKETKSGGANYGACKEDEAMSTQVEDFSMDETRLDVAVFIEPSLYAVAPDPNQVLSADSLADQIALFATTSEQNTLRAALAHANAPVSVRVTAFKLPSEKPMGELPLQDLVARSYCADLAPEASASKILDESPAYVYMKAARQQGAFDLAVIVADMRATKPRYVCRHGELPKNSDCGDAFGYDANETRFFAFVEKACAFNKTTLSHEVGHLLGTRHELHNNQSGKRFNHGTRIVRDRYNILLRMNDACVIRGKTTTKLGMELRSLFGTEECPQPSLVHNGTLAYSSGVERYARFSKFGTGRCNDLEFSVEDTLASNVTVVQQNAPLAAMRRDYPIVPRKPPAPPAPPQGPETPGTRGRPGPPQPPVPPVLPEPSDSSGSSHVPQDLGPLHSLAQCASISLRLPDVCEYPSKHDDVVFFERNTATPKDASVAQRLASRIGAGGASNIAVLGFASSSGSFEHNLVLSSRRAGFVADLITSDFKRSGRESPRITICPYGWQFSRCHEETGTEDNAMRVEIVPLPKGRSSQRRR